MIMILQALVFVTYPVDYDDFIYQTYFAALHVKRVTRNDSCQ